MILQEEDRLEPCVHAMEKTTVQSAEPLLTPSTWYDGSDPTHGAIRWRQVTNKRPVE